MSETLELERVIESDLKVAPIHRELQGELLRNPAQLGWPPTMVFEIAMRVAPIKEICEAYHITREEWNEIRQNKAFIAELAGALESLRKDGAAFRVRAGLQSLALLDKSWQMIHDPKVADNIKADLLKFTVKVAGLDASKDQGVVAGKAGGSAFMIQINMGAP